MSRICSTCLSVDRRLVSLRTLHFVLQWIDIEFDIKKDLVCWECHAIFMRLHTFRRQAGKAQEALRLHRLTAVPINDQNLSKLSVCSKGTYDAVYYEEVIKTEQDELEVKREFLNEHFTEVNINDIVSNVSDAKEIKKDTILEARTDESLSNDSERRNICDAKQIEDSFPEEINEENKFSNSEPTKLSNGEELLIAKIMTYEEMIKSRDALRDTSRFKECSHKCTKCIKMFLTEETYKKHVEKKHSVLSGRYVCGVCEVRFMRSDGFNHHYENHFKCYQCKLCEFTHHNLHAMVIHLTKEHKTESKHACSVCKKFFNTREILRSHNIESHKGRPKCTICQKTYKCESALETHLLTHTTRPDERAYCTECGVQYKNLYVYQQHLLTHSKHRQKDVLKYACAHCEARFFNKHDLSIHISVIHFKKYPFTCNICKKGFCRQNRLREHVKVKHEGIPLPKDKICPYCGKGFVMRKVLADHIRVHTGERPFQCEQCPSTFKQKSTLQTHVKLCHINKEVKNAPKVVKRRRNNVHKK